MLWILKKDGIMSSNNPHLDQFLKIPLKQQLVFLIFTVFYFVRWFVAPMSTEEWAVNIIGFFLFLALYFFAFSFQKYIIPIGLSLVALSVIIAPYNFGSNCFIVFASNFFAYSQPTRRAAMLIAFNLLVLTFATVLFEYHWIYYFLVGFIASLGSGASAIFDRQRMVNMAQKNRSLDEVQRLAKIAERERIGQDIHDLLGHTLTVVNLKAQLAKSLMQNNEYDKAQQEVDAISSTTQRAIKEIREAVTGYKTHNLRKELDDQKEYLDSMGVALEVVFPEMVLPPNVDSQLLMIVREALNNVLKHSKASQATVSINNSQSHLSVNIRDNGIGNKKSPSPNQEGNGLKGMWQRIESLGGQLTIRKHPGFQIDISIPWKTITD